MFEGSIVALVTPMHQDGSVDYSALKRLVEFHVENETSAIVSVGTTGESATLSPHEHIEVIARTVEYAAGRIPVIGGTGGNATSEAIELTRQSAQVGVAGCLIVVPYYNKPTQEGLYLHFKAIAEAVAIPQILYNVPSRTACDLSNSVAIRLSQIDNIVGIKDATSDMDRARELVQATADDFAVLSGNDDTALELMRCGGSGVISVTANVAPREVKQVISAALAGEWEQATAFDAALQDLHRVMFVESNPIPAKWALQQLGLIGPGIRLPMTALSQNLQAGVRQALQQAGRLPV
ncbi:MAG TPA: 4-hydroxy-tetrahydrodipicolinate synthase [Gammaproteobacteria bacterium]|nr:4-hydroxy-tetrahydrodipicolinate synthase [Gammaproteobacteria bacterium]